MLGFVEGEGSFFITKGDNFRLGFSIGQSIKDLPLMEEVPKFLNEGAGAPLPPVCFG